MRGKIHIFGRRIKGQDYIARLGVYGVIRNEQGEVALLQTRRGYFLPGGGVHGHETVEEALHRESMEECGYALHIGHRIGETIDYFYAAAEETYFRLHSVFFAAAFTVNIGEPREADHQLVWCSTQEAANCLSRPSQVWAIRQVLDIV
jgi:8-oxo-dGTP diphosphatase